MMEYCEFLLIKSMIRDKYTRKIAFIFRLIIIICPKYLFICNTIFTHIKICNKTKSHGFCIRKLLYLYWPIIDDVFCVFAYSVHRWLDVIMIKQLPKTEKIVN